ncbi:regulator of G protein signaling domain protein [Dictyocaulus viviparus]|uniref:Regulator of G protein signaling domain protein n=1 Tax=Dictyocaulus viviparus TaxID=29172 RepID=A0A0D8XSM4_DICVI|nr:regulator of G protein signaling domain protein [Dictyocaulus viviparus]
MSMFDAKTRVDRPPPPLPVTDGVEYPRAASWASGTCANVLKDEKGCQLFRCFLHEALAEENLSFIEAVDKLKKMKSGNEKKEYAKEILQLYSPSINLSSTAMKKMRDTVESENVDPEEFAPAVKEVKRLLENDQFPRFRRSEIYLNYLERLLPRSYAERWMTSFEALLGNHVGRHHFRLFLREIHAEENLRFWEAVVEFRAMKNKSPAQLNAGKSCLNTFLAEGANNEVFLPFGVRQVIERKIHDKDVDITLFDEAIKHVEQVLRNDPYVRFLQSPQYLNLLSKLH